MHKLVVEYGYESDVLRGTDNDAVAVSVDVSGVELLRLEVDDAGDGKNSDSGDWADAKVVRHADPAEPDPEPEPGDAAWTTPFGYRGEYTDAETGYVYLRARYYDPEMGRFISEDPVRDGMNWYVYAGNNPIMFVDPLGLFSPDKIVSSNNGYDPEVMIVQMKLNILGYKGADGKPLAQDGLYGSNTQYAIQNYQRDHGLSVDGILGVKTWTSMGFPVGMSFEEMLVSNMQSPQETGSVTVAMDQSKSLPITGEPNSSQTIYNPDGSPKQTRFYGPDGKPTRDIDYNHPGDMEFPHSHGWSDGQRNKNHEPVPAGPSQESEMIDYRPYPNLLPWLVIPVTEATLEALNSPQMVEWRVRATP